MVKAEIAAQISTGLQLINASYAIPKTRRGVGRSIISEASLSVLPGQCLGLLGANGTGKTTLLKVLAGHLKLNSGQLFNNGISYQDLRRRYQKSVHLVTGAPLGFYPRLTGIENLRFVAGLWGIDLTKSEAEIKLAELGIDRQAANSIYAKYSLGMRQRVHLATAQLDPHASVILWDEPTTGLDVDGVAMLKKIITGSKNSGKVQIVVSHDKAFFDEVCTQAVTLINEKLVA